MSDIGRSIKGVGHAVIAHAQTAPSAASQAMVRERGQPQSHLVNAGLDARLDLRRETTMTLGWIAERLAMGTPTHLAHLLYWREHTKNRKVR